MSLCGTNPSTTPSKERLPVISVNGVLIEETQLANELQYHPHGEFDVVVQRAGQALVIQQLLLEQAVKEGIDVSGESEEAGVQLLLQTQVKYDDPDEDDCLRYFKNNRDKFTTAPLMEVDHILLAAANDDLDARDDAKSDAMDIISTLKNDLKLFGELAKHHSVCPSKETGGSLGQISNGQTVPEFERQLMMLPEGLAEKPLESRYGLHVVNVARKVEGKALDYSLVQDKVRGYLVHRASHLAIQAYIHGLVQKADIQGVEVKFSEDNVHV
ncbi:peptidylprolyl isomerase [Shewanella woodyi]|uniref:peptidylprolyl isomerase n=1 Tax=Shewanella woodyi (strain ATCC 51908 / MS32) TaxID=392500 RepID=B1KHM2_SHEWM|nr:peptidylprolyl isomerase [Shewanella woodyi]ACA86907.1 PpiC-type peptidyl-prolyl cis-trans isomerase [Shewanella woodyi ATCC 51908]